MRGRLAGWAVVGAGIGLLLVAPVAAHSAELQAGRRGLPADAQGWLSLAVYVASPLACAAVAAMCGYLTARETRP